MGETACSEIRGKVFYPAYVLDNNGNIKKLIGTWKTVNSYEYNAKQFLNEELVIKRAAEYSVVNGLDVSADSAVFVGVHWVIESTNDGENIAKLKGFVSIDGKVSQEGTFGGREEFDFDI